MEYRVADSIRVEKWSLFKRLGLQVIPYHNAVAAWNQSLKLNAMVHASTVMVLSVGYEVTYNCFL